MRIFVYKIAIPLIAVFAIVSILHILYYLMTLSITQSKQRLYCTMNLEQIAKGLEMYRLDVGKQKHYPQKNGQGFLIALYKENLNPANVFLCPCTTDTNSKEELEDAPDEGDAEGPVSYAGRNNANPNVYPGLFATKLPRERDPLAADDFGAPHNHDYGNSINILFLDFHVEFQQQGHDNFPNLKVLGN